MSERHQWEQLLDLMNQEYDELNLFSQAATVLKTALHNRDWPCLENGLNAMHRIADRIDVLERKRVVQVQHIAGDANIDRCIQDLEPALRSQFKQTRTLLKNRLQAVRSHTQGIVGYADSRMRLGRELMEELIPSTRGRIYDKRGISASAGQDPMVLSRHL